MATKANKLLQFLSFFLVLFLFVGQLAVFQLVPKVKADPDWLSGWTYRKSHVITNATGAGTDYQVRIKAHYSNQQFSQVWDSGNIATGTAADTARNIVIDGDYLYAVSESPKKLVIYNISNPSSPVQESLISLSPCGGHDIRKKGNYLFIACAAGATSSDGVFVYDVSDVTSPSYVTTINLGGETHGMFILGDYLYCCQHIINKFVIVDISNPTSPVVKGSLSGTTYFHGCHDCHVEGNYAYVTNYLSTTGEYGFVVVDVSDKDNPSVVGYTGENHKNSHVFKVDNYCYVGSHSPDSGMRIYNVTTPSSPSFVGQYFTSEGYTFAYWIDDYDSNTLTVVGPALDKLYLIDISNPTSPSIKKSVSIASPVSNPKNVAYSGGYFYVSCEDTSNYYWRIRSYQLTTASDSGEDVYLNSHCRTDFGDVRFTKDDGVTLLDYWMEEKVDSDYAIFWVKITDDLSSSDVTIYIYYGKSDATTTSNGDNTFLFFDDFSGTSLDSNKWDLIEGDVEVSDGNLVLTGTSGTRGRIEGKTVVSKPVAFHSRVKWSGSEVTACTFCGMRKKGVSNVYIVNYQYVSAATVRFACSNTAGTTTSDYSVTTPTSYHIYKTTWKTGEAKAYFDGTLKATITSYVPTDDMAAYLREGNTGGQIAYVDWYFIRKWVDPEPGHGSWGSEEESGAQEYSHTFTETLSHSAILNQWQEQFRIWMETVYPSATMNLWREISYTYTQTVTATETVTYLQEHIRVMQESLSPSEFISYWQEQKHVFSETASPTATLKRWLEGMHVFFETVHPSTTLSHWIEAVFRFTEPLSVSEQLQPIQAEAVFTLTQTITPSETVTYLQEQQYILTETATPTTTFEHWIEGITVFTETFTETLCQTATVHYWIEMSHTLTETLNPQTLLETAGEIVYVLTETLTENAQSEIAQELLHKMFETLKPTTVFNIAKELVETFITNIETVHAQAVLYKQIFTPTEEINTALVLAAFAAAIAIIALSLTITKKE